MEEKLEFPVAQVSPGQVEEIRRLEERLSRERDMNVVLIAYEEKHSKWKKRAAVYGRPLRFVVHFYFGSREVSHQTARSMESFELPQSASSPVLR